MGGDGDGGGNGDGDGGGNGDGDGGTSTPDACVFSTEVCDESDNDCDGTVDEFFDLQDDPDNCGSCGNACELPGVSGSCASGVCSYACSPTFHDLNDDLDQPNSDGCEYGPCTPTGDEECNFVDDDCDNELDEDITGLDSDPDNCGGCFNACILVNVVNTSCVGGDCTFDACVDDKDGQGGGPDGIPDYADVRDPPLGALGCEYPCPVNPPLAQELVQRGRRRLRRRCGRAADRRTG
jgi:hypothetical protein